MNERMIFNWVHVLSKKIANACTETITQHFVVYCTIYRIPQYEVQGLTTFHIQTCNNYHIYNKYEHR